MLLMPGSDRDEALTARAGLLAGFSSVGFLPGDLPPEARNRFIREYSAAVESASPGEAFDRAAEATGGRERFRLYGSGGVDPSQRAGVARRHLDRTRRRGDQALQSGEATRALRDFGRALALARELADSTAEEEIQQRRLEAALPAQDVEAAIEAQTALVERARQRGNWNAEEAGWRNLASLLARSGRIDEAGGALHRAAGLADPLPAAGDRLALAALLLELGAPDSAAQCAREALRIFRQAGDVRGFLQAGMFLGKVKLAEEDYAGAARDLEEWRTAAFDLALAAGKDAALPAEFYRTLGAAYDGLTDYDRAADAYLRALETLADTVAAATALTHQDLAGLYSRMGRYAESLAELRLAQEQFAWLDLPQYLYLARSTEALIALNRGEVELARERALTALEGALAAGDRRSQAQIERQLGMIELAAGQPEKSRDRLLAALARERELGSQRGELSTRLELGRAWLVSGRADSARVHLFAARTLADSLGDVPAAARARLGLGRAELLAGNPGRAGDYLEPAAALCRQRGLWDPGWRLDLALAQAMEAQGREGEASGALDRAMEEVEAARREAPLNHPSGMLEEPDQVYRLALELQVKRSDGSAALLTAERARSLAFQELLDAGGFDRRAGLDWFSREEATEWDRRLALLNAGIRWLRRKGPERTAEESARLAADSTRLDSLQREYRQWLEEIEARRPGYRSLADTHTETPTEIRKWLAADEALVEYYPTRRGLALLVAQRDTIFAREVDLPPDTLLVRAARWRHRLERRLNVEDECRQWHRRLIAPVEQDLRSVRDLIIIPAGPLGGLPFAALQDGEGRWLGDRFTVSQAPSATDFVLSRRLASRRGAVGNDPLLAVDDPAADDPERRALTARETASLGLAFPGAEVLSGEEVRASAVADRAADLGGLHFAVRGAVAEEDPLASALRWGPEDDLESRLMLRDVFRLRLERCALVSLSAWDMGKPGWNEAPGAWVRAFFHAGSPRVAASLWPADGLASALLVKHLYRNLRAGQAPAEALRQAQAHLRDRLRLHPADWAACVLYGEPGDGLPQAAEK